MCCPNWPTEKSNLDRSDLGLPQLHHHPVVQHTEEVQYRRGRGLGRYNRAPSGHSQADKGREKLLIASSILMPAVSRAYMLMEKIESNLVPMLIWSGL
jgi:hypothetical protein